jgi:hypothetical protein
MSADSDDRLGGLPFDVGSFFNLSVSSIAIGAAVVIGYYAFQAVI